MLVAALALMLQQAAPPPAAPEDEITVIGRRMRDMRFAVKYDRRRRAYRCIVRRTSGDPALDTAICDLGLRCTEGATSVARVEDCVKTGFETLPGLYASERRQFSRGPAAR
ncbi:hypothetical protein QLH51_10310 [Sphingomonas sp. 2R-10]|uniref:hypothetical protein n=1 Tax=Sphingomonas sp. 2R-10 TaxID=3045148 RepID=UPI000F7664E5|nr:hypothetical protein [Sphingomonas sp. 2R-10]MDJ0277186.1 hypothetical protein [Sphingomonas sp. 2R-10]